MKKYGAQDAVRCICHAVTAAERAALEAEKSANVAGMVAGARGEDPGTQSGAHLGHAIGERALREFIATAEPGIEDRTDLPDLPFGIRWDFYGVAARQ